MSERYGLRVTGRLLELIAEHSERGYAISVRELGAAMGWSSPATCQSHLYRLRRLGLVDWVAGEQRTLHLTAEGRAAVERRAA